MVSPLLDLHPAGFKIIESVLGREIDRFVYGMYAPELLPDAPLHEHSSNFTNLVGSPLARIDTPSPYHLWTD